jgi:hypothetical protein
VLWPTRCRAMNVVVARRLSAVRLARCALFIAGRRCGKTCSAHDGHRRAVPRWAGRAAEPPGHECIGTAQFAPQTVAPGLVRLCLRHKCRRPGQGGLTGNGGNHVAVGGSGSPATERGGTRAVRAIHRRAAVRRDSRGARYSSPGGGAARPARTMTAIAGRCCAEARALRDVHRRTVLRCQSRPETPTKGYATGDSFVSTNSCILRAVATADCADSIGTVAGVSG